MICRKSSCSTVLKFTVKKIESANVQYFFRFSDPVFPDFSTPDLSRDVRRPKYDIEKLGETPSETWCRVTVLHLRLVKWYHFSVLNQESIFLSDEVGQ